MNRRVGFFRSVGLAALLALLGASAGKAAAQNLRISLTGLQQAGDGCIATLNIENGYAAPLDRFSLDVFVIDTNDEAIDRTLLDIAPVPTGQFSIALPLGVGCGTVAHLLIYDLPSCRIQGDTAMRDCHADLQVSSRLAVDLRK
jgi:hypothetical protein